MKVSESTKAQIAASNELSNLNVSEAEKSLSQAEAGLTANEDGIVESVDVVQGAYANETQTVMTIIKSDEIGVEFTISKDDLGYISNGQRPASAASRHHMVRLPRRQSRRKGF